MRIQFLDERRSTYTVFGQYLGLVSCHVWASAYCFLICKKFISLLQNLTQSVLQFQLPQTMFKYSGENIAQI